jgi:hypothetical protein
MAASAVIQGPDAGSPVSNTGMWPGLQAAIAAAAAAQAKTTNQQSGGAFGTALDQAKATADAEIGAQVAPLQGQITQFQKAGTQEQNALGAEYNSLLPYAQSAAAYTGQFNRMAASDSNAIFQAAGQQMNTLQQNAAAEAQRVAQQTGGPVSTGTFTAGLDPYAAATQQSGAVGGLTSLELGVIGTDQANQFAGQVLPAMELEDRRSARMNIDNHIADLRSQIATIQGTKSKLIDAKLPELLTAQRNYELNKAKLAQSKVANDRSWTATQRALDQKDAQLALAEQAQLFAEGVSTKKLNLTAGQLALEARRLTDSEKQAADKLGLSYAEYALRANHYAATEATANKRVAVQEESNARMMIDGIFGGANSNKPVTITQKHYLDAKDPLAVQAINYASNHVLGAKPPSNVFYDAKRKQFYTYTKSTMTPQQFSQTYDTHGTPISDPNAMYRFLRTAMPDAKPVMLQNLIKAKLGLNPDWKPGDPASHRTADLNAMSLSDLTDLAVKEGFPPTPHAASRQALIDYIHAADAGRGGVARAGALGAAYPNG